MILNFNVTIRMFPLQLFLVNQANKMVAGFYSSQRLRHLTVS